MKLIIEIDVDSSDMEESDADLLIQESKREGAGVMIQIGSAISEEESEVARVVSLSSEYFTVSKQE